VFFELEREKDLFYRENKDEFDFDDDDFSDGRMYDEYSDDDDARDINEIYSQALYKKSRKESQNESTLLDDFERYLAWKEKRKGKSKSRRICDEGNDMSISYNEKERKAAAAEAELLAILEKEEKQLEKKKSKIKNTSMSAKKK